MAGLPVVEPGEVDNLEGKRLGWQNMGGQGLYPHLAGALHSPSDCIHC